MSARASKRPKMAPNATNLPNLKSEQDTQAAQARLKFEMALSRGRRGALKTITEMPMDILYEICSQLHLRDLYHLSITTRSFHDFLLKKSHRFIWKAAFANVPELPPCPEGLIEPVWARLLYSSLCTLCGEPNVDVVTWQCPARLCSNQKCIKQPLISECRVHTILDKAQYEEFKKISESEGVFIKVPVVAGFARPCYVKSHLLKVMKAWEEVPEPRESLLSSFVTEWQQHTREREQFIAKCKNYLILEANKRRAELLVIRNQRLEDICEGLRALGWGPEVDYVKEHDFQKFRGIDAVWQEKELTPVAWRDMRDDLVDCVKSIRVKLRTEKLRLRWSVFEEVGAMLLERSARRHPDMAAYRFSIHDLAMQDEAREILDVPEDATVTRAQFQPLEKKFEKIFKRWRAGVCKQLRDTAPKGTDPLQLATTVFSVCRYGQKDEPELALFPFLTTHRCTRSSLTGASDAYERFVHDHSSRPKSQTCHYVGCADLRQVEVTPSMRKIVQLFGLDPDTATVAQMDAVDARLVVNWRDCMTWRGAMKEAAAKKVSLVKLATERELPKIKRREKQMRGSVKAWMCGRCDVSRGPKDRNGIEKHLRDAHGIQSTNIAPKDVIFLDGLAQELMTDPQLIIKWRDLR